MRTDVDHADVAVLTWPCGECPLLVASAWSAAGGRAADWQRAAARVCFVLRRRTMVVDLGRKPDGTPQRGLHTQLSAPELEALLRTARVQHEVALLRAQRGGPAAAADKLVGDEEQVGSRRGPQPRAARALARAAALARRLLPSARAGMGGGSLRQEGSGGGDAVGSLDAAEGGAEALVAANVVRLLGELRWHEGQAQPLRAGSVAGRGRSFASQRRGSDSSSDEGSGGEQASVASRQPSRLPPGAQLADAGDLQASPSGRLAARSAAGGLSPAGSRAGSMTRREGIAGAGTTVSRPSSPESPRIGSGAAVPPSLVVSDGLAREEHADAAEAHAAAQPAQHTASGDGLRGGEDPLTPHSALRRTRLSAVTFGNGAAAAAAPGTPPSPSPLSPTGDSASGRLRVRWSEHNAMGKAPPPPRARFAQPSHGLAAATAQPPPPGRRSGAALVAHLRGLLAALEASPAPEGHAARAGAPPLRESATDPLTPPAPSPLAAVVARSGVDSEGGSAPGSPRSQAALQPEASPNDLAQPSSDGALPNPFAWPVPPPAVARSRLPPLRARGPPLEGPGGRLASAPLPPLPEAASVGFGVSSALPGAAASPSPSPPPMVGAPAQPLPPGAAASAVDAGGGEAADAGGGVTAALLDLVVALTRKATAQRAALAEQAAAQAALAATLASLLASPRARDLRARLAARGGAASPRAPPEIAGKAVPVAAAVPVALAPAPLSPGQPLGFSLGTGGSSASAPGPVAPQAADVRSKKAARSRGWGARRAAVARRAAKQCLETDGVAAAQPPAKRGGVLRPRAKPAPAEPAAAASAAAAAAPVVVPASVLATDASAWGPLLSDDKPTATEAAQDVEAPAPGPPLPATSTASGSGPTSPGFGNSRAGSSTSQRERAAAADVAAHENAPRRAALPPLPHPRLSGEGGALVAAQAAQERREVVAVAVEAQAQVPPGSPCSPPVSVGASLRAEPCLEVGTPHPMNANMLKNAIC